MTTSQIAVGIPFVLTLFGVAMLALAGVLAGITESSASVAENVASVAARVGVFCVSVGVAIYILEWVSMALWQYLQ